MTIQSTHSNVPTVNLRYSAFLGMLYASTPESEAFIKDAKALVGEAEVKRGYSGNKGHSSSATAIDHLRSNGVTPVKVMGTLTSARIVEHTIDGRITPYLNVGLKDEEGRYYLSIDLNQAAAQMLVRKLANAEIGVTTEINLFASYSQRPGASRAYADHGASLKQSGVEIKSVNPKESLVPRINADIQKLKDAGISDDKETFAKRRAKIELDFHCELLKAVTEKVDAYYAQIELPNDGENRPESDQASAAA
jgi:hypothetical protein